ncbi:L-histidine N(alpha)-methyltransferase [Pontibacter sp. KCTC 32443]|uniref:L-histidine N(alpha)-methyltransferase n=1 Tax=Pontibacter TaxID=323449 RepID=UPI00164D5BBB|nr:MULTISPECIES: L-histidine N(alpha)-methyltransferase [Pontibacter]MBC5773193.1 L-histidine N(alpha)-methyltransferase [Pontibacter sp. KCTC 32443]
MTTYYSTTTQITDLSKSETGKSATARFAQDVKEGLSQQQKQLSSRYFYDGEGSRLFQKIMHLPEYYLTRSEHNVFTTHQQTISSQLAAKGNFHLIDLGAGDATKTKIILRQLLLQQSDFDYVPVDISGDAMVELCENLHDELPELQTHAVVGDYFDALDWLDANKPSRKVLLFLGSNIGNFNPDERMAFLKKVRSHMQPGDMLLIGMDLCKEPETILRAYDDAAGVTADFNLNLLHRINRELGGNFDVGQFKHFALYDPQEGVMKSFLISQQDQEVSIKATGQSFYFHAWEAIHTESSYKFTLKQAETMGQELGFELQHIFQDKNHYFADVLYVVT